MKQVKFLFVALMAIVMSVSVTSCFDNDDNNIVQAGFFVKNDFGTLVMADGMKLNTNSTTALLQGNFYYIFCQYDRSLITENSKSVNITLLQDPICIDPKSEEQPSTYVEEGTNPLYAFNSDLRNGFLYFDQYTLITPIIFWYKYSSDSKEAKEEFNKHSFKVSYDPEKIKADDTKLELTINHIVRDKEGETIKRDRSTNTFKAYNLRSALEAFRNKTGKLPKNLVLKAKDNSYEDKLIKDKDYSTIEIEYPFEK